MSQQPPPFPSSFARPPQHHYFPPTGVPPQGVFGGPPPPPPHNPPFSLSPFPPFSAGSRGLPTPVYPPPFRPPLPPPSWRQQQQPPELPSPQWRPDALPYIAGEKPRFPPPERPSPQWRPEAQPFVAGEKPRLPLGPEAAASAGGLRRDGGGGDDENEQWLSRFLACRRTEGAGAASPPKLRGLKPSQAGLLAAEALRLLAQVAALCGAWRRQNDHAEAEEVAEAEARLAELREVVRPLRVEAAAEPPLVQLRRHAEKSRKKRLRRQARRQDARAAREEEAAREAEREARIESWRARRALEVEERHREQELKAAADSVLSEVRKKQADTKRMAEILRGLEKLRKLRKEAAARKGVCPPPDADEAFENEVQSLRALIKTRTELYEAEERALRVMLEGEQEEERKREMEKKLKREKEKVMQQKREMDSKLFGEPEELPLARLLEPFTQYYLQAEYSVPSLIQIRHEWDRYLVPTDHPEGNFIPPGWVIPCQPSSDIWATAVG